VPTLDGSMEFFVKPCFEISFGSAEGIEGAELKKKNFSYFF